MSQIEELMNKHTHKKVHPAGVQENLSRHFKISVIREIRGFKYVRSNAGAV